MFRIKDITEEVRSIAKREVKPIIAISIDQIADELEKKHGKRPSKSMIWEALRSIGAVSQGRKFVYRHNESKGE